MTAEFIAEAAGALSAFPSGGKEGRGMGRLILTVMAGLTAMALSTGAGAGSRTQERFDFADPFSGSFDCGTFTGSFSGHDHGNVVTWFDANGDPIMQEGHIRAIETDVNDTTKKSVEATTSLNVHVDFVAGTTSLTGVRNLATDPGRGVVVQHVGRVVIGPDGEPISLSGKYADFAENYMSEDFCAAVS
jgi:hypothetical protein